MITVCLVTVLNTTHDYFDYLAPSPPPPIGVRVWVTLRGKKSLGIVTGHCQRQSIAYKLSPITDVIDDLPIISEDILSLLRWASHYYQSPLSETIKNAIPKRLREGKAFSFSKKAAYQINARSPSPPLTLNQEQAKAVEAILPSLNSFQAFLLFGITGSGKTEVYFHIMDAVLKVKQQILLIVPEIGLTPQLAKRLGQRFEYPIALLHSKLNDTERLDNWLYCHHQKASILIGTRSAIFTPLPNLGLIIIDESHDLSFKQQDSIRYSARDLALKRAYDKAIPIILGSATPSLETLQNAINKKYCLLRLTKQAETNTLNHFQLVDLRNKHLTDGLCELTLNKMSDVLKQQKQVMVFINRRGYSPVLICHECAWIPDCTRCSAHLTYHQKQNRLQCHHCGYQQRKPSHCQQCQSIDLIPVGAGTERITDFLTHYFKDKRVLRIDKDTTSKKNSLTTTLHAITEGEYDILVGTQLLAKGHHFPLLQLVVILDADSGFFSHDFRAIERLGQQITQVSGRAGRVDHGEVLIQTHQPDNPFLLTLIQKGYHAFALRLLEERKRFSLPPFSYLAMIRTKGRDLDKLFNFLTAFKTLLNQTDATITVMGPAPAPMAKKAGLYHAQLLVKSDKRGTLSHALNACRDIISRESMLKKNRYTIDIDPQELS